MIGESDAFCESAIYVSLCSNLGTLLCRWTSKKCKFWRNKLEEKEEGGATNEQENKEAAVSERACCCSKKYPRREKYPRKVGGGGEHPGVWGQIIGAKISGRRYLMMWGEGEGGGQQGVGGGGDLPTLLGLPLSDIPYWHFASSHISSCQKTRGGRKPPSKLSCQTENRNIFQLHITSTSTCSSVTKSPMPGELLMYCLFGCGLCALL